MRITISGSPGSGTTTLGRSIAEKYSYRYVSAGEVFRGLAKERNMDLAAFGKIAETDPAIDLEIDARQKEIGESSDDIILEGRLSGWMVENADLKILLCASPECRSTRIAAREGLTEKQAFEMTVEREACEAGRYMEYYEIDILDFSPYDLILNSETFSANELFAIVDATVSALLKRE
ncbi:(d)CMP kinase [uncultured Methanocorpusculum sp.]|nr:AAA family ATPase [uncultured Methanocorpusculum sp.]